MFLTSRPLLQQVKFSFQQLTPHIFSVTKATSHTLQAERTPRSQKKTTPQISSTSLGNRLVQEKSELSSAGAKEHAQKLKDLYTNSLALQDKYAALVKKYSQNPENFQKEFKELNTSFRDLIFSHHYTPQSYEEQTSDHTIKLWHMVERQLKAISEQQKNLELIQQNQKK